MAVSSNYRVGQDRIRSKTVPDLKALVSYETTRGSVSITGVDQSESVIDANSSASMR